MIIGELNGYTARVPITGGKAGRGCAVTSTIQVVKDGFIVKQFRFKLADQESRSKAISKAKQFMAGQAVLDNG